MNAEISFRRNAIVTGATSGIGKAVATRLLTAGHNVVANARHEGDLSSLAKTVAGLPGELVTVAGDASSRSTVDALIEICQRTLGGPPSIGLVNAGSGMPGTLLTSDEDRWQDLVNINLLGSLRQLRALAAVMVPAANATRTANLPYDIVVVGSAVGRFVSPVNSVYGATKFAVHSAAEALRREIGPQGVRVSLIEPGVVGTNFQSAAGYDRAWFSSYADEIGPILQADDVAKVITFVLDQPANVHVNDVMVRPTRQPYP